MALAFDEFDDMFHESTVFNIFDMAANCFFILDIFLQMNSTYYDNDGEEIFDKKQILRHYIFGAFIIDLLSSLPIELFTPVSILII